MIVSSELAADGGRLDIRLSGRFDFSMHEEFKAAYDGKIESGDTVVVDLAGVEYMDSSALGMLLLLREYLGEEDADVRLINGSPEIRNILHVSNFEQLFKIE